MKKEIQKDGSWWSFGMINGKLAEFHFEIKKGKFYFTYGHCYVKREEFKTRREQKMIDEDIKKYQFTYRKGKYRKVGDSTPLLVKHFELPKGKLRQFDELLKKYKLVEAK